PTQPIDTPPTTIDADLPTQPIDSLPTEPVDTVDEQLPPVAPSTEPDTIPVAVTTIDETTETPAVFDEADLAEYPTPREPFKLRVIFILSIFGIAAALMTIVADVVDIRTTRPAPGIVTGSRTLADLGTNLDLAVFAGAAAMVLGSLLACFGLRWGAGVAGGAGLALAGWAGLTIGLAEVPIAVAESITRSSSEVFVLRVTRDLGWWLILGVGVLGLLVFIASLRSVGTGGRPALNPLVAAVTAVAGVILAFGPLVPVGQADFADNFRSTDPSQDLPTAFFAGRLGQVVLIGVVAVVGMLIVRSWGLGLAAGGVTVAATLWITSLIELGDRPIGIADRNPGATNTVPHAVTTVGMVATLALLAIAAALATYRLTRRA
ncbi:MAG: hypothetical protein WBL31_13235, partial [Ilumatobacteraceae bacterium]